MPPVIHVPLRNGLNNDRCLGRGRQHVYRFNRYVGQFNYSVHPRSPERFPTQGVFRCTECGSEIICSIKHRK